MSLKLRRKLKILDLCKEIRDTCNSKNKCLDIRTLSSLIEQKFLKDQAQNFAMLSFSETSSTAHNKISIYLYPYYFLRFQEKNPGIDESIYVSNLTVGSYTTHTHTHTILVNQNQKEMVLWLALGKLQNLFQIKLTNN